MTSGASTPATPVTTATCAYSTISAHQCRLKMPATVGDYLITVLEKVGPGPNDYMLVQNAFGVSTNANPMAIKIK